MGPKTDPHCKLNDAEIATIAIMASTAFYELIVTQFATERERFNYFMHENPDALEAQLRAGEEKARAIANQTLARVREKLGFN